MPLSPERVVEIPAEAMPDVIQADYTVQPNDYFIRYDSSLLGRPLEITLPDPSLSRRELKFIDVRAKYGDSNGAKLLPHGSEDIGGLPYKDLPTQIGAQTSLSITSDLVDWWVDGITF